MATKDSPQITHAEFDEYEPALRAEMETWLEQELAAEAPPAANPATAPVWSDLPVLDSKTLARASPVVKKHLGVGIDPKLIRKGGYSSVEEALDDLLPKLRATCLPNTAAAADAASP